MGASASKFGGVWKAGLAVAGLATATFVAGSVKSFAEHEQVLAQFQNTLSQMPQLVGETSAAFEEQATALQNLTGFQDEEILAADNVLARFKLTGDQIRELIPVVLDYARATGQDVASAATGLGRAMLGNTRALKTIGINFVATGDTAKDFATIMDLVKDKVGGAAETFGKTATGQLAIAKAKFDDIQEAVGKALMPVLTDLLGVLSDLMPVIQFAAQNLGILLGAFLGFQAIKFLPGLLLSVSSSLAALGEGAVANKILGISTALAGMGTAATAGVAAFIAFGSVAAVANANALPDLKENIDEATGSQEKWNELVMEGASAGRFAGSKTAALAGQYLEQRAAAEQAADGIMAQIEATVGVINATNNAIGPTGNLTGKTNALAAAHRSAAAAASDEFTKETLLAGGVVAIATAQQQAQAGEKTLTALRKQGKVGTQEYAAAVAQQTSNVLAVAAAVSAYETNQNGATGGMKAALGPLAALFSKYGLTAGALDHLAGSASNAKGQVDAVANSVNNLHDKTVNISVITHYSSTGTPGTQGGIQY